MPGEQRRLSLKAQTKGGGLFLMSIFTHFLLLNKLIFTAWSIHKGPTTSALLHFHISTLPNFQRSMLPGFYTSLQDFCIHICRAHF